MSEIAENPLATAAVKLASALPDGLAAWVAKEIGRCRSSEICVGADRIAEQISHAAYRALVIEFMACWRNLAADASPEAVSFALLAALHAVRGQREEQTIELVWTGPQAGGPPLRRTEQVILQLLDEAQTRVTLVSYAVYGIPNIRDALVRAAQRGVRIRVVVETPDRCEGQSEYSTLRALGARVAACSKVYYWPQDKRPTNSAGHRGILHAKCAAADAQRLYLSSANLTEYAFNLNLELGIFISGGPVPGQVEAQFDNLIAKGDLAPLE